jgi:hypothetical protein
MDHLEYRHFLSRTQDGAEAMVMPMGDCDCIGFFADQVKLTHALVQDLEEAVKEVKLLGDLEEESIQKIIELEALCKKLREEKTTLEGMVESRDELLMEMAKEYGLNRIGENDDDEDEDDDDGGDAAAPHAAIAPPPALVPPATTLEISSKRKPLWRMR